MSDTPVIAKRRMTVADLVAAGVSLAAAVWAIVESGRWPAPEFVGGPAVVPRIIAAILFVAAGALVWYALRGQSEVIEEPLDIPKKQRIGTMVLVTATYAAALEPVGFLPSTIAYLAIFAVVLGLRRWVLIAAYAVLLPSAIYVIFGKLLKVPLPPTHWPF
ncbi:tripartite tricarboxylate transporter TctB family protein [Phreatobacter aquaticus]|uniref:Tripartite tricarboxylate transporter TctB family protein n=1 Tax=Phreatobacter aquaticus TaxID=2570229 RepID=A0A4D7QL79_9HYPH|nr:tripartite tricarboxylate transporter TctB family protein [Phreatobacter aquaticus]QCK86126.1 tripartite tricarboxylate transporter TctB family protein [Phreatobacter aquaticus]